MRYLGLSNSPHDFFVCSVGIWYSDKPVCRNLCYMVISKMQMCGSTACGCRVRVGVSIAYAVASIFYQSSHLHIPFYTWLCYRIYKVGQKTRPPHMKTYPLLISSKCLNQFPWYFILSQSIDFMFIKIFTQCGTTWPKLTTWILLSTNA